MALEFERFRFRVAHSAADYMAMLAGLLPKGKIWGFGKVVFQPGWQETPFVADAYYEETPVGSAVEFYQESLSTTSASGDTKIGLLFSCLASELERIDADAVDILDQSDPGLAVALLDDWEYELGTTGATEDDRQRAAHAQLYSPGTITDEAFWKSLITSYGFTGTVEQSDFTMGICGLATCGVDVCDGLGAYCFGLILNITAGGGSITDLQAAATKMKPAHGWVWVVDQR